MTKGGQEKDRKQHPHFLWKLLKESYYFEISYNVSLMIRVFSGSPFPVNTIYSLIFKDVINIVSTHLSALLTITVVSDASSLCFIPMDYLVYFYFSNFASVFWNVLLEPHW